MTAIPFDTYSFYDELATKGDIKELELRIEQVRCEIEVIRTEAQANKVDLIKWFVGTAFAIASIGFMLARFFDHGVL